LDAGDRGEFVTDAFDFDREDAGARKGAESSTRRKAFPRVRPKPRSKGFDDEAGIMLFSSLTSILKS
jgi:hypothetical protein